MCSSLSGCHLWKTGTNQRQADLSHLGSCSILAFISYKKVKKLLKQIPLHYIRQAQMEFQKRNTN